jgi:hypothetical protein
MTASTVVPSVREGCRWLHNTPSGSDFGDWFRQNAPLHEGMDPDRYVNGMTLIPNKETYKYTALDANGIPSIVEGQRLVFSPYPQVETRVRYFWDWCEENGYLGEIEAIVPKGQSAGLPPGVFQTVVPHGSISVTWLCASFQVKVWSYDPRTGGKGRPVMLPPLGSKHVQLNGSRGPDVNAAMRAQTGALGRALGNAGMLVIPGTGVSSAEDMLDIGKIISTEAPTASLPVQGAADTALDLAPVEAPEAPAQAVPGTINWNPGPADLGVAVKKLMAELSTFPAEYEQFVGWASERGITDLASPGGAALRPLEKQLQRKLVAARKTAEAEA